MTKSRNAHLSVSPSDDRRSEDAALVRQAKAGDRAALEALLVRSQAVAFRFSFLVCGHAEDAEDVMQEALLKTFQYVSRIRDPKAFRTWLYSTVRNACLMKRRLRVDEPRGHVSIDQGVPDGDGGFRPVDAVDGALRPDAAAINAWLGRRLRAALAKLPPMFRVILFLREMEGLSTKEVAGIMRLSEANVKQRLHRARHMLREQLEDV